MPDRSSVVDAAEPIPITARIVWGEDGEQPVDGVAVKWTRDLVLVEVRDPRCATIGPWLHVTDVKRSR